jgi:predicted negative regulator of RcsB-dependent stress response
MKNNSVVKKWWKNNQKLLLIFSCLLALVLGWGGNSLANAVRLNQ